MIKFITKKINELSWRFGRWSNTLEGITERLKELALFPEDYFTIALVLIILLIMVLGAWGLVVLLITKLWL